MENKDKKNNLNFILIIIVSIFLGFVIGIVINKSSNNINQSVNINATAKTEDKININTATQKQLEILPSVGEVKAKKIIEKRPYKSINELVDVVGEKTFIVIKDKVEVS
ncbi:ComEA family DNA-binding protein [Clostridium brassicae]|uniref:Helix-hairpin-helix domain-containing protein n=1 Tax=Clostridium brassicae TaxID=2999072 RepID=A0ABT4D6I5_9CLOT|nr:helix-hairpin-helix domain-containing protein [Clostridium brassicae]MCY6957910.1 helix-hairpin-helix domain-containing protein [Clostridium brassicae]